MSVRVCLCVLMSKRYGYKDTYERYLIPIYFSTLIFGRYGLFSAYYPAFSVGKYKYIFPCGGVLCRAPQLPNRFTNYLLLIDCTICSNVEGGLRGLAGAQRRLVILMVGGAT
jgi:hypothetical protein